jgi:hypothetical protein
MEKAKIGYKYDNDELNDLQRFLLHGPIMSNDQFEDFKKLRKDFDKWLNLRRTFEEYRK